MNMCFPEPYPDELFYSMCSRYGDRMRYPGQTTLSMDLFGTPRPSQSVEFPSRLDRVVARLPPSHSCFAVERLILSHTMYAVYAPFISSERANLLIASMRGELAVGWTSYARLSGAVNRVKWLQFCPDCVAEDRQQHGETYWRRCHQLPGSRICHVHGTELCSSQVALRRRRQQSLFDPAEYAVDDVVVTTDPMPFGWRGFFQNLASDVSWLLSNARLTYDDPVLLRQRYRQLIHDRGLMSRNGRPYLKLLNREVVSFFSADFLEHLGCGFNPESKQSWVANLVNERLDHEQHPLHHLLLIQYLGVAAKTVFDLPSMTSSSAVSSDDIGQAPEPFGSGPWPCLNSVCESYRQPVISQVAVEPSSKGDRPRGRFACACGYTYLRLGPDQCPEDTFRAARVEAYGQVWDQALTAAWEDHRLNLRQLADRLGTLPELVKHQAYRLGLRFPRLSGRGTRRVVAMSDLNSAADKRKKEKTQAYRRRWETALMGNPEATITRLDRIANSAYRWLKRNDSDWLRAHLPAHKLGNRKARVHNSKLVWAEQDESIAAQVRTAALEIRNKQEKPERISRTSIFAGSDLDISFSVIQRNLPRTLAALIEVTESRQEYAIRKIECLAEQCRIYGRQLPLARFVTDLHLQNVKDDPGVVAALEAAMARQCEW